MAEDSLGELNKKETAEEKGAAQPPEQPLDATIEAKTICGYYLNVRLVSEHNALQFILLSRSNSKFESQIEHNVRTRAKVETYATPKTSAPGSVGAEAEKESDVQEPDAPSPGISGTDA